MTWRLAVTFAFPWGVFALLGFIMTAAADFDSSSSGSAFQDFVNSSANPNEVNIDQPSVGTSNDNPLGGAWEAGTVAVGWLSSLARAASLDYPFFTGDLVIVRWFLLAFTAPMVLMAAKEFATAFTNMLGGIFGKSTKGP